VRNKTYLSRLYDLLSITSSPSSELHQEIAVNTLSSPLSSGCHRSALRPLRSLENSLVGIFCILGFAGCVAADGEEWATDTVHQNALTLNALTLNALTLNALTLNALTLNALTLNRLDGGVLVFDSERAGDLPHTESGRQLLQYIARCALVQGDVLRVESSGDVWHFPGLLGMAPSWETESLDLEGQQIMTGCLLAHVNAFGVSVPLSVRSNQLAEAGEDESAVYFYGDGAFYGNLYLGSPKKYACEIRANRFYDASTGSITTAASPYSARRICADRAGAAQCEMVFTGYCDQVCGAIERDGNQWRFSECLGADGNRYHHAVTVWLEGERAESCDVASIGLTCEPN
jgi:hypothetical protein